MSMMTLSHCWRVGCMTLAAMASLSLTAFDRTFTVNSKCTLQLTGLKGKGPYIKDMTGKYLNQLDKAGSKAEIKPTATEQGVMNRQIAIVGQNFDYELLFTFGSTASYSCRISGTSEQDLKVTGKWMKDPSGTAVIDPAPGHTLLALSIK